MEGSDVEAIMGISAALPLQTRRFSVDNKIQPRFLLLLLLLGSPGCDEVGDVGDVILGEVILVGDVKLLSLL